ncbi:MAG: hypothetical protein AAB529_00720 [Patescibacteria group bacterium]
MDIEYILFLIIGVVAGVAATWLFELILKTNKNLRNKYYKRHKIFWGYHIHHSTYGLVFILLNIVLFLMDKKTTDLFYTALGIGIIIMHTISDGRVVFIEKQKS